MLEFKWGDFVFHSSMFDMSTEIDTGLIARRANTKLRAWLEQQPVVYVINRGLNIDQVTISELTNTTSTARLVCIEPIVRDSADAIAKGLAELKDYESVRPLIERARKLVGK